MRRCGHGRAAEVHLRVGGGTESNRPRRGEPRGASPRGRRNRERRHLSIALRRCISAWAEEPRGRATASRSPWVHLRVGGGTDCHGSVIRRSWGASPRGRRNRGRGDQARTRLRCISAWAEEPDQGSAPARGQAVHLRVGGGTDELIAVEAKCTGASPRGRRNPACAVGPTPTLGCISAWAEEPMAAAGL